MLTFASFVSQREKQRGGPDHLFIGDDDGGLGDANPNGIKGDPAADTQDVLLKLMSDVVPADSKKEMKVFGMTTSQMASIRSALPSKVRDSLVR